MALSYTKFDTTPAGLAAALRTAILACSDWADITPAVAPFQTTTSAAIAAGVNNFLPTSVIAGIPNNQKLVIDQGLPDEEILTFNFYSGSQMYINGNTTKAHAAGAVIKSLEMVLKCTTTRGANMVVDLLGAGFATPVSMPLAFYRSHTGATNGGVDKTLRNIQWKGSTGTATLSSPLHVLVSVSKEHLFVQVEGPRGAEAGTTSATYGSQMHYFFIADLVPYHAADTVPAVILGANFIEGVALNNGSHVASVSRNSTNTSSWSSGKLASLSPVQYGFNNEAIGANPRCSIDGNLYLLPYVFVDDLEGIRGRLARIFHVGVNVPTTVGDMGSPAGVDVVYEGLTYTTLAANHADNASQAWGSLGACNNQSTFRSVVIAIPRA